MEGQPIVSKQSVSEMRKQLMNASKVQNLTHLIVGVQLPSGAIEVIHNTTDIPGKIQYYLENYVDIDYSMCLKHNNKVMLVGVLAL